MGYAYRFCRFLVDDKTQETSKSYAVEVRIAEIRGQFFLNAAEIGEVDRSLADAAVKVLPNMTQNSHCKVKVDKYTQNFFNS